MCHHPVYHDLGYVDCQGGPEKDVSLLPEAMHGLCLSTLYHNHLRVRFASWLSLLKSYYNERHYNITVTDFTVSKMLREKTPPHWGAIKVGL
jgi:hypothetical protein